MTDHFVISIIQPVFLPWLGYMEQMAYADLFVLMDDAQYTKQDWRNRNRIKTSQGPTWISVPVKKHPVSARINEIEIDYSTTWVKKHGRILDHSLRRSPFASPILDEVIEVLEGRPVTLVDLDRRLLDVLRPHLGISTPIEYSSSVPREREGKTGRLVEICRHFGADVIYNGARSEGYLDVNELKAGGVEIVFQNYQHPVYSQPFGVFESHMACIDLIANVGPDAPAVLRSSPLTPRAAALLRT